MSIDRKIFGGLLLTVAVLSLGYVGIQTAREVVHSGDIDCHAPANFRGDPTQSDSVYTDATHLSLNGRLCLGISPGNMLADSRVLLNAAIAEEKTASSEVLSATATRNDTDKARNEKGISAEVAAQRRQAYDSADTALKAARDRSDVAKAALAQIPRSKTFQLVFDGLKVPGDTTIILSVIPGRQETQANGWLWREFNLASNADADTTEAKAWRRLLGGANADGTRKVSVGLVEQAEGASVLSATAEKQLTLTVYQPYLFWIGVMGMTSLLLSLLCFGWGGNMLRDEPTPGLVAPQKPPFSLSRVQFLWWMFLVIGGFLFIWLVTGQYANVITEGVLTLLGISGLTAVSARVVDALPVQPAQQTPPPPVSVNFLRDIVTDGTPNGSVALHRVQIVLWNLILGAIFLWTALREFSFPVYGQSLLILAGIVNTTYVGFKFPEKK